MSTIKNTYPNLLTAAEVAAKAKFTDEDFQIGVTYYVPEFVFTDIDEDKTSYYKLVERTVRAESLVADLALFAGSISEGGGGAFDSKTAATVVLAVDDDSVATGGAIVLTATVTDPDNIKEKVEFWEGDTKLGEDAAAPFTQNVAAVSVGVHNYIAKVFDSYGNVNVSNVITVTATNP